MNCITVSYLVSGEGLTVSLYPTWYLEKNELYPCILPGIWSRINCTPVYYLVSGEKLTVLLYPTIWSRMNCIPISYLVS